MFIGYAIFLIEVADRDLSGAPVDLIPRLERLLQEEVRFNGLFYLVKREAEFTRRSAAVALYLTCRQDFVCFQ